MSSDTYSRKISSKEADEGFIFILKSKLSFFPDLNDDFEIMDGKISQEVMVDSYPCTCRGPNRPHEHYFINWNGLEAGNKIEITKSSEGKYNLKIQR